jgi:hypothetical protein
MRLDHTHANHELCHTAEWAEGMRLNRTCVCIKQSVLGTSNILQHNNILLKRKRSYIAPQCSVVREEGRDGGGGHQGCVESGFQSQT